MLNWLKKLLGVASPAPTSTENKVVKEAPVAPPKPKTTPKPKKETAKKTTTKKTAPKKKETVDFSSMSKTQLLEEAKARGIKANASLKKDELIQRLESENS